MKKHGFSEIAFWWSTFGLLLAHTILFLVKPNKINYMALKGLITGIKQILNGEVTKLLTKCCYDKQD